MKTIHNALKNRVEISLESEELEKFSRLSEGEEMVLYRGIKIQNSGQMPLEIKGFSLQSAGCDGFGFRIENCQPLTLMPEQSHVIQLSYQPNAILLSHFTKLYIYTENYKFSLDIAVLLPNSISSELILTASQPLLASPYLCCLLFFLVCGALVFLTFFAIMGLCKQATKQKKLILSTEERMLLYDDRFNEDLLLSFGLEPTLTEQIEHFSPVLHPRRKSSHTIELSCSFEFEKEDKKDPMKEEQALEQTTPGPQERLSYQVSEATCGLSAVEENAKPGMTSSLQLNKEIENLSTSMASERELLEQIDLQSVTNSEPMHPVSRKESDINPSEVVIYAISKKPSKEKVLKGAKKRKAKKDAARRPTTVITEAETDMLNKLNQEKVNEENSETTENLQNDGEQPQTVENSGSEQETKSSEKPPALDATTDSPAEFVGVIGESLNRSKNRKKHAEPMEDEESISPTTESSHKSNKSDGGYSYFYNYDSLFLRLTGRTAHIKIDINDSWYAKLNESSEKEVAQSFRESYYREELGKYVERPFPNVWETFFSQNNQQFPGNDSFKLSGFNAGVQRRFN